MYTKEDLIDIFNNVNKDDLIEFLKECDLDVESIEPGKGGFYLDGEMRCIMNIKEEDRQKALMYCDKQKDCKECTSYYRFIKAYTPCRIFGMSYKESMWEGTR